MDTKLQRSPVTENEFNKLKEAALFTAEDEKYLRMAGEILVPQTEQILDVWYGFVGSKPFLLQYFANKSDGKPNGEYLNRVRARFGRWIKDTTDAKYDQAWLIANKFYWQYRDRGLNVLGLSTAFEDFEYNSEENTELLLTQKQTIGETRKALGEIYEQPIDFSVAMDRLSPDDRHVSLTFTLNHLPGTPTFLLLNRDCDVLDGWFGHAPEGLALSKFECQLPKIID